MHIAMKHHEQWSAERAGKDWKLLSKLKPDMMKRRDIKKDEFDALKGHIDDKYLPALT